MLMAACSIVLPLVLVWPRKPPVVSARAPVALASMVFASALMALVSAGTLWLNWDRPHWRDAGRLPVLWIAVLLSGPFAISALTFVVARRIWPSGAPEPSAPTAALSLAPGERAYWAGSAFNGWLVLLALFVMLEGGIFSLRLPRYPQEHHECVQFHVHVEGADYAE